MADGGSQSGPRRLPERTAARSKSIMFIELLLTKLIRRTEIIIFTAAKRYEKYSLDLKLQSRSGKTALLHVVIYLS